MENHHFNRRYISKWWISHCYVCTVFSKKKMMAPSKNPPQAELGRHSIWTHRIPSLLNPRQNQKLKTVGFKLPSREPSHIPPNRWKPEHHQLKKVPAGMGIKKKAPKGPKNASGFHLHFSLTRDLLCLVPGLRHHEVGNHAWWDRYCKNAHMAFLVVLPISLSPKEQETSRLPLNPP